MNIVREQNYWHNNTQLNRFRLDWSVKVLEAIYDESKMENGDPSVTSILVNDILNLLYNDLRIET